MRLYDFYVRFSDARRFAECLSFVRAFPRQINIRASEMTERRGLTINRAAQIEHLDNARRTEIKQLVNNLSELFIRNNARTLRINQKGDRTRTPMAYASSISQRLASPEATIFLAI